MAYQKFRWSNVYESSEEELIARLQHRGLTARQVIVEASGDALEQLADHDTTVWCAEGSLRLTQAGSGNISLQPGDALTVAAGQSYRLQPGMTGFTCYFTD